VAPKPVSWLWSTPRQPKEKENKKQKKKTKHQAKSISDQKRARWCC
jgi:hypothetical protein